MSTVTLSSTKTVKTTRAAKPRAGRKIADQVAAIVKPKATKIADLVKKRDPKMTFRATIGADPELMIWSVDENRIVSSIPILKRDKHNPITLDGGVKLYADNVLCEFSFPPSESVDEMLNRMKDAFARIQDHLGDKYQLIARAAHTYLDSEMEPSFGVNPREIGCTPSIDVYREEIVAPNAFPDNMRTGSFHIHLGNADYAKDNGGHLLTFKGRHAAIRLMDIFVGCGSVIFDKDPTSAIRRTIYGAAGNFRMTPYGAEYRPLSPGPLASREMTKLCLDLTDHVLSHIKAGTEQDVIARVNESDVKTAINTCDAALATDVLTKAGLPSDLMARVQQTYAVTTLREGWGI